MMLSKLLVKSEQALEAAKKDSASELGKALERHEAQREALALSEQQLSKSRQGVAQMRSQMQKKLEAMEVANAGSAMKFGEHGQSYFRISIDALWVVVLSPLVWLIFLRSISLHFSLDM